MKQLFCFVTPLLVWSLHVLAAERAMPKAPEGFVVQLAASEPLVKFPMFACFDDAGRLFVAESSGLDLYDELQKLTRRCRISVLEDRDGDGVFETGTVFADKLVFPMGLAWREGKLYVADPPELVTLEDTDGDGRADKRTKILDGFGHQDNGSLHGLTFGPDGLLYMTMGQPDGYRITKADGTVVHGTTGAVLRCRPDGSHPEVIARGFENAVEVCFLPGGQIIATDNWFQLPAGGVRDALVHIVEGGLYPHVADRGSWQIVTGDTPMPAVSMFPAVALSGMCRYEGAVFPDQFRGNLYTAQHNTRKVQRHVLKPSGYTFTSENIDFVTSEDPDFHPSDLLEDADGSLLVVDTGGWYVQHCPTGKIRDSKAPGGIYRVRAKDVKGARRAQTWADGVWGASASQTEQSREAIRRMLDPMLAPVRSALAARTLISRPDRAAAGQLAKLLQSDHADVRLAAAQALASSGDASSVSALVEALRRKDVDRIFEHALVHALHYRAALEDLRAALRDGDPRVHSAALMLLDQPPHRKLEADAVFSRLTSAEVQVARTALWILKNHPEWAGRAGEFFTKRLGEADVGEEELGRLSDTIVALGSRPEVVRWLGEAISKLAGRREFLLRVMSRVGKPKDAAAWVAPLRGALKDPVTRAAAIATCTAVSLPALDEALAEIAGDGKNSPDVRLAARRATVARRPRLSGEDFDLVVSQLAPGAAASARLTAADLVSRAELDDERLGRLLKAVRDDPLITPDTIRPLLVKAAKGGAVGVLLDYLSHAQARGWTPGEQALAELLKPVGPEYRTRVEEAMETVRKRTAEQRGTLDRLASLLGGGDETRGRELFFGKATCGTCHKAGPDGGAIGPDLTKVGAIRSGQDLLESIVYPSSTIAQGYDNYIVTLSDGDVLTGFLGEKSPDAVTLTDATGVARRLAMSDIREMRRGQTSVMPQGLDQVLTADELRDVLAYLQGLN